MDKLYEVISSLLTFSTPKQKPSTFSLLHIAPVHVVTPEFLYYLEQFNFIHVSNQLCKHHYSDDTFCEEIMELVQNKEYKHDGYALKCPIHGQYKSIRANSFFAGRRQPLSQILYILKYLSAKVSNKSITTLFKEKKLDKRTISDILRCLQSKMLNILESEYKPIFDPSDEVEIDEMWWNWRDPNDLVGPDDTDKTIKSGKWIIGIINRTRSKLWIQCIPDRSRKTFEEVLKPLFISWFMRKPRIHTDALKSYEWLEQLSTHYVINKAQEGFGRTKPTYWGNVIKCNVNTIENCWMLLRQLLRLRRACNAPQYAHLYIAEFMYNTRKLSWLSLIENP
jgi:hypothetical protein